MFRMVYVAVVAMIALTVSACSLFGSPSDSIPEGRSSIAGVIRYVDDFPAENVNVELAGEEEVTGETGTFMFHDVTNGRYTLTVTKNGREIGTQDVVLSEDVSNLEVVVGENLVKNGAFEGLAQGSPPEGWRIGQVGDAASEGVVTETTVDNGFSRTGVGSVRVYGKKVDGVRSRSTINQHVLTEANATYRLTAWVYFDGDIELPDMTEAKDEVAFLRIRFYDLEGNNPPVANDPDAVILNHSGDHYNTNATFMLRFYPETYDEGVWNQIMVEFKAPDNTDRILLEAFFSNYWHDKDEATLWWDDIQVVRID